MSELFLATAIFKEQLFQLTDNQRAFFSIFLNDSSYYLSLFNYKGTNYVGKKLLFFYTGGFRLNDSIGHFESLLKKLFPEMPLLIDNFVLIGAASHEYDLLSIYNFSPRIM